MGKEDATIVILTYDVLAKIYEHRVGGIEENANFPQFASAMGSLEFFRSA